MFSSKQIEKGLKYKSGSWFSVFIFPFLSLFLEEGIGKNTNKNKYFLTGNI